MLLRRPDLGTSSVLCHSYIHLPLRSSRLVAELRGWDQQVLMHVVEEAPLRQEILVMVVVRLKRAVRSCSLQFAIMEYVLELCACHLWPA